MRLIQPYYYRGQRGRKPKPIETMLRMYLLRVWFSLSDEGVEEAIYDSYAMRRFMGLDFAVEQVPDATTLLHFRHLLEKHNLGEQMFAEQNRIFDAQGWVMRVGSIVDATIIAAPSSTKNATGTRDPEMHQTKKGNQWFFGMKAHIGVDAGTGYVHSVTATAANVHDLDEAAKLVRTDDEVVYADAGGIAAAWILPARSDLNSERATGNLALTRRQRTEVHRVHDGRVAAGVILLPIPRGVNESRLEVEQVRGGHPPIEPVPAVATRLRSQRFLTRGRQDAPCSPKFTFNANRASWVTPHREISISFAFIARHPPHRRRRLSRPVHRTVR